MMKRYAQSASLFLASLLLMLTMLTSCSLTDKIAAEISGKLQNLAGTEEPEPVPDPVPVTEPDPEPVDAPVSSPAQESESSRVWKLTVENDTDREITELFAESTEQYYSSELPPVNRLTESLAAGESVTLDLTDCADVEAGSPFELIIQTGDVICSINSYPLTPGDTLYLYRRSDMICAQAEKPAVNYTPVLDDIDWHPLSADCVSLMTPAMKDDWNKIVDTVIAHEPSVQLSGTPEDVVFLHTCLYDWRLCFLVDVSELDAASGTLNFTYTYASGEQEQILNDLKYELLTALNAIITRDMNTTEKVMAVYSWCSNRMEYDYGYVEDMNASYDPYTYPDLDIRQGLSTGLGVCHTYSYLAEFMLQQLGIECLTLKSDMYDGTRHAWLCVKLDDGQFYHFDPTWEHTDASYGLTYFGMSDDERAADGVVDYSYSYCYGYGPVSCGSEFFYNLRDVWAWSFGPGHTVQLYCNDIDGTVIYNTVTGERSVPMAADYVIEPYEIPEDYWNGDNVFSEGALEQLSSEEEAAQREALSGEWKLYCAPALADAAWLKLERNGIFSLKIDEGAGLWDAPVDGQTEFTYNGTWELYQWDESSPLISLRLHDTDDPALDGWNTIGDFTAVLETVCDGEEIFRFDQQNNGDSAFSMHLWNVCGAPGTFYLRRDCDQPQNVGQPQANAVFNAKLWKSRCGGGEDGSNDFVIWMDEVMLKDVPGEAANDIRQSVPYTVCPDGGSEESLSLLSGGNDGLFAYGCQDNCCLITTDEKGQIVDARFVPMNPLPDDEEMENILACCPEISSHLDAGMSWMYDGFGELYGLNVRYVLLGTEHEDAFTTEYHYAVAWYDQIYRYDPVYDTWEWVDLGAAG